MGGPTVASEGTTTVTRTTRPQELRLASVSEMKERHLQKRLLQQSRRVRGLPASPKRLRPKDPKASRSRMQRGREPGLPRTGALLTRLSREHMGVSSSLKTGVTGRLSWKH